MTNTELLLGWEANPVVIGFAVASIAAYAVVERRRATKRTGFFAAALVILVVALLSPVAVLARGYLFSAHMLQHLLLLLAVPPLVLLSLAPSSPESAPSKWRILPLVAWGSGVGAMWLWHAPMMCNAAAQSVVVQDLQTFSLLAMGGAFWWPILAPRRASRLEPFAAITYLFTACIACTILGVIVTFSPVAVCNAFAHPIDATGALALVRDGWGMSAKSDQEIGGLLMWVPTCVVYTAAILGMLGRYYAEQPAPRAKRTEVAS